MKERDLLKQLKSLSGVKPDATWKESNKELLLAQINATSPEKAGGNVFGLLFNAMSSLSQPVMVVLLLFFVLGGVGVVGFGVGEDSKPGDSLYIAKKISEKTRSTFTFDEKKKVQLGLEFAKNRAKEIEEIKTVGNEKDVERLVEDFKREIIVAKERIEKIYKDDKPSGELAIVEEEEVSRGEDVINSNDSEEEALEEPIVVHSADSGEKDENGISVSAGGLKKEDSLPIIIEETEQEESTSTQEVLLEEEPVSSSQILIQVEELVKNDDFGTALKKLEEMTEVIEGESKEEDNNKAEDDSDATSTEDIVEELENVASSTENKVE